MSDERDHRPPGRRLFLKAASGGIASVPLAAGAQTDADARQRPASAPTPGGSAPGYVFFRPSEADFFEALSDHMVPEDAWSASGTAVGIPVFADRALSSGWGHGERLNLQGPAATGSPNQGYQLLLTPAQLFRTGTETLDRWCVRQSGQVFALLPAERKEAILQRLRAGEPALPDAPPAQDYFNLLYRLVIEGFFSDPIYGGNRDKAGWRLIGFPGISQSHRRNIVRFKGRKLLVEPVGIAELS